jgi:hypothetical protein
VKHAHYHWRFLAEGHLNRPRGLDRIGLLPVMLGQIDVGKVGRGIRLQRGGKERCCKKAGHKWQAGILVRISYRVGALQMKIVSQVASWRNRCTITAVFEVKKGDSCRVSK